MLIINLQPNYEIEKHFNLRKYINNLFKTYLTTSYSLTYLSNYIFMRSPIFE